MPKQRGEIEAAAGQLISAVQKELGNEIGEPSAPESEAALSNSHYLLQAAKANSIDSLLAGRSVAQFLGESWVGRHPHVIPSVKKLQILIKGKHAV